MRMAHPNSRVTLGAILVLGCLGAGSPQSGALYNGIRLPDSWPPVRELSREPSRIPYLDTPPKTIPIDVGRQLFVDDFLIAKTDLSRTFHQPVPYERNPVLTPDKPWEQGKPGPMAAPFSDGVWFDPKDRTFKMWYLCATGSEKPSVVEGFSTCYADSPDGLRWRKPALDVVPGTNIVLKEPRDSTVVWLDHREPDPARRFKLLRSHTAKTWGVSLHYSPDGIHWTGAVASNHGPDWVGDRTTVFFNPFRNVWVYSIRNSRPYPGLGRMRYYSESADLAAGLSDWKAIPWVGADRADPVNPRFPGIAPQLYALDGIAYESLLLGMFSIWQGPENSVCAKLKIQKRNEILLGFSRDGFHWARPGRRPFLGVDEKAGAWNGGNMQSVGAGCLLVGDRLFFYSSGRKRNDESWDANAATGVFFLRRDGFASLDAGDKPGTVTTQAVTFSGSRLFVNFEARDGGTLRAEVLDAEGRPIAPFTRANSVPIGRDTTRQAMEWRGTNGLSALNGTPVRFRFHVRRGSLYSFWVSPGGSGASMGYAAGGGPGLDGERDIHGASGTR